VPKAEPPFGLYGFEIRNRVYRSFSLIGISKRVKNRPNRRIQSGFGTVPVRHLAFTLAENDFKEFLHNLLNSF